MDQKLDGICVLNEKQLFRSENTVWTTCTRHLFVTDLLVYLCLYFKTLGLLFVVGSGVVYCVVKMNRFSIAA